MMNKTVGIAQPNEEPAAPRRGLWVKSALAGAIVLALAGAQFVTVGNTTPAQPALPAMGNVAPINPPSFADIAERVTPAVVNVAVSGELAEEMGPSQFQMPDMPEGTPFHEFFKRFFDERSRPGHGLGEPKHVQGVGSGFIISPDGYVVTNNHVVDGADEVNVVLNDGSRYKATVTGRDSKTDLAVLKIDVEKPLPYVEFGDSNKTRVGDWVLAVGNPFGLGGSVTAGIVSARGRDIHSGPFDDYLQVDAPINRGNSGGPLFDSSGRVIGVNTAIFSPSGGSVGIGFAIPSTLAGPVVAQLEKHGQIERGWLGVQIQPVTEDVAASFGLKEPKGALVAAVVPDSPAAKSGLLPGDVILSVAGKEIDEFKAVPKTIAETRSGTQVLLEVQRKGSLKNIPVLIGQMPNDDKVAMGKGGDAVGESQPKLGLYLAPLTPDAREALKLDPQTQGVLVVKVENGSPAEKAGIRPGSVISMVGQHEVNAPAEVVNLVREAAKEERSSVLLLVEKGGERHFVAVRLAT